MEAQSRDRMYCLRGSAIRVQTLVLDAQHGPSPAHTAAEHGVSEVQVREAHAFCQDSLPLICERG
jgi:uncharacterized protein (DUF433 family)